MLDECLVCREHRLDVPVPGDHLVATDEVVAFHMPPWPPPAEDVYLGHLLVTSRRHVMDFGDLTDHESAVAGQTISRLTRALRALGADRVYLAVIGHGVPHLHIHLVPRWPGTPDDVSWTEVDEWPGARRGDFAAATELTEQLRCMLVGDGATRREDGYGPRMTEPSDEARIERRADLLPEELVVGSDNPKAQARAILEESDERTEEPGRTRRESTQAPD